MVQTVSYHVWVEFLATVKYDTENQLVQLNQEAIQRLCEIKIPHRLTQRDGVWRWDSRPVRLTPLQKCILDAFQGRNVLTELELANRVWGDSFKKHRYIADKIRELCDRFDGELLIEYSAGNWLFSEKLPKNFDLPPI